MRQLENLLPSSSSFSSYWKRYFLDQNQILIPSLMNWNYSNYLRNPNLNPKLVQN